jgi:flagellar basal body-associated protein FliL
MVARIAGSMVVSVAVLMVVSLLVGFGVLWWTGSVVISASIGTLGGLAAAFAVDALHAAAERAGERLIPNPAIYFQT